MNVIKNMVVSDLVWVFLVMLELVIFVIFIGMVFGVFLGIVLVVRCGIWVDYLGWVVGLLGYFMLIFWLGIMVILIFYVGLGWILGGGWIDFYNDGFVEGLIGMLIFDVVFVGEWEVFVLVIYYIFVFVLLLGYVVMVYFSWMSCSFMLE